MRMRLNRPWATTRGARAPVRLQPGEEALRRAGPPARATRRRRARGPSPPRASANAPRTPPARGRRRTGRPDQMPQSNSTRSASIGQRDPVRRRHDRGRLLRPHHRARPHGVDPFLREADRERLGLAPAARRERRVETRALQGAGEVAFALAVPREPDQHVGRRILCRAPLAYHPPPHDPLRARLPPRLRRARRPGDPGALHRALPRRDRDLRRPRGRRVLEAPGRHRRPPAARGGEEKRRRDSCSMPRAGPPGRSLHVREAGGRGISS